MNDTLEAYIKECMKRTSNPKYWRYIDEFVKNITEHQLKYWDAWMNGKMSIY